MPKTTLPSIAEIEAKFSKFSFKEHEVFYWSPQKNTVFYNKKDLSTKNGIFKLLHEVSHALLGHTHFSSGIQLVRIEASAWRKAQELAGKEYGLEIPHKQIQHCLTTYRDWLYQRSLCPTCQNIALEVQENRYHCFNCFQKWKVPGNQQLRNYRLKIAPGL